MIAIDPLTGGMFTLPQDELSIELSPGDSGVVDAFFQPAPATDRAEKNTKPKGGPRR